MKIKFPWLSTSLVTTDNMQDIAYLRVVLWLFVGAGFYALASMHVMREFIIPVLFPASISGFIPGDPYYYHGLVAENLKNIELYGFDAFEFRPAGQGVAGIATLLYLIYPDPISIVFTNAVLHGLSISALYLILSRWFQRKVALIAIIPPLLSPYMILWFSQINKESFALAGTSLFVLALLNIFDLDKRRKLSSVCYWFIIFLLSIVLFWIVRPYVNQILLPIVGIIAMSSFAFKMRQDLLHSIYYIFAGIILISAMLPLSHGAVSDETLYSFHNFQKPGSDEMSRSDLHEKCLKTIDSDAWQDFAFFPDFINNNLQALMGQRCLIFTILKTHDHPVTLNSIFHTNILPAGSLETIWYLPTAMLAGLVSPGPGWLLDNLFVEENFSPFFLVAIIETSLFLIGILGIILYLYISRRWSILTPIIISAYVVCIFAAATPLFGALYRYRFPWWTIILCVGIAATLTLCLQLRNRSVVKINDTVN